MAALVLAILSIWPRHYVAEAQLLPQDNGGGLSAAISGQQTSGLLSLGALMGNKQPVEAELTIARSHAVLILVAERLHLLGKPGYETQDKAAVKLRRKLSIISIRGSILQITAKDRDGLLARNITATAAEAIKDRVAAISVEQAAQRRSVAADRLKDAAARLAETQAAVTQFQTDHKLAAPTEQLGAGVGELATLEGRVQAEQVELSTLRQFATEDNFRVRAAEAELAGLQAQVASAKTASPSAGASNLAGIALINAEYFNLYRDAQSAEILYQIYRRYLEAVAVDEMSADQSLMLVEPAYIYPERQFNMWAVGLLAITIILGVAAECYLFLPPVGSRFRRDARV